MAWVKGSVVGGRYPSPLTPSLKGRGNHSVLARGVTPGTERVGAGWGDLRAGGSGY